MEYIRLGNISLENYIGERLGITFLAKDVAVKDQKDGGKFIVLNMVDKDKIVQARKFGVSKQDIEYLKDGGVYNAMVDIKPYEKSPEGYSCLIYTFNSSDESPNSFVEWAEGLDYCSKYIADIMSDCMDTCYGRITYNLVLSNWGKFSTWTAAKGQHHAMLGGLLLHTCEVLQICGLLAEYFNEKYSENFINKPLLYCSAILHDIGKIFEYDVDISNGKVEYSLHSALSTHIMDVISMVELEAYKLGYGVNPNGDRDLEEIEDEREEIELLKHCLAAHHGKLEYGSPITASVPEAYIVNMADEISAEMFRYNRDFKNLEPGDWVSIWSSGGYNVKYKDTTKIDINE